MAGQASRPSRIREDLDAARPHIGKPARADRSTGRLRGMGKHDEEVAAAHAAMVDNLETVSLQAWNVAQGSQITVFGTYRRPEGPQSANFGALHLPYQLLSLPSLGQVLWTLGDEVRRNWSDLSMPL